MLLVCSFIMMKDVGSLLDHTSFNFERLEFLQASFLGLVDMEQNRIIKIFTVVTVIFMLLTLIASAYGINFRNMPEAYKPRYTDSRIGIFPTGKMMFSKKEQQAKIVYFANRWRFEPSDEQAYKDGKKVTAAAA